MKPTARDETPLLTSHSVLSLVSRHARWDTNELSTVLREPAEPGPSSLIAQIQRLVETGCLDRIAARAVYLILNNQLDPRDLKQLLPRHQIRLRRRPAEAVSQNIPQAPIVPTPGLLGRYRIEELIHTGPHGHVYRGRHPEFHRAVAIKVAATGWAAERLRNEAAALAGLHHRNLLRVWDAHLPGEHPYLVSEYLPRGNLRELLSRRGRLPVRQVFRIARDVTRGLRAAWRAGFTHGDIKPSNLLLDERGRTVVADFGLASRGTTAHHPLTSVTGSWPYLAPERFDQGGDQRSDIYSLGLTLYHMLTGVQPVTAQTPSDCYRAHLGLNLDPPHWSIPTLSLRASQLILRMVAKDPNQRPAHYDELLEELIRIGPIHQRTITKHDLMS